MLSESEREVNRRRYHRLKESNPFHHKALYIKCAANRKGLDFDLDADYLESIWTGVCAISGISIELYNHRNEDNHAELDRTFPHLGYVKGNVAWLSRKFNRLKSDATVEDTELILSYLRRTKNA